MLAEKLRNIFVVTCLLCLMNTLQAQEKISAGYVGAIGLKTNLLYWGTVTPNLGLEVQLAPKWSFDIEAGLHPFDGKNDDGSYDRSLKHFRLHPEVRYWFCETFHGHFVGLHVPFLIYNIADIKLLGTEGERHQGWGTGAGISYGYSWLLGKHWNLEASLGVGYLYLESDIYPCTNCGTRQKVEKKHYVGPTQAAVNLIYVF